MARVQAVQPKPGDAHLLRLASISVNSQLTHRGQMRCEGGSGHAHAAARGSWHADAAARGSPKAVPGPKISSMQPMGVRSSSTSTHPSVRARLPTSACGKGGTVRGRQQEVGDLPTAASKCFLCWPGCCSLSGSLPKAMMPTTPVLQPTYNPTAPALHKFRSAASTAPHQAPAAMQACGERAPPPKRCCLGSQITLITIMPSSID